MRHYGFLSAGLIAFASAASAQQLAPSPTLDAIKARGHLECGVHLGLPGFSFANDKGEWSGIDVDYCKALAAAVLGDATKVKFTPTSVQQRWPILQSGQVDLLSRNTTITFSRNATLGINFQGINFYEGQTFIVRTSANAKTPDDLDGASVCVAAGSTEEKNAADWFPERKLKVTIINFQKNDDAISAYDSGRCDAYTAGVGALAGQRIKLKVPGDHMILTELISNDPQGPVTRWGDERWQLVVRWVLNGMIAAEALGVTSKNVDEMKAKSTERGSAPPARRRGRLRRHDGPVERLDVQRHQAGRELRRELRAHRRHGLAAEARARQERAVDQGRPAVHLAVSVRAGCVPHAVQRRDAAREDAGPRSPALREAGSRICVAAHLDAAPASGMRVACARAASRPGHDGVVISFLYEKRVRDLFWQAFVLARRARPRSPSSCVNASRNMRDAGIASGFDFLWRTAGIEVPFVLTDYTAQSDNLACSGSASSTRMLVTLISAAAATVLGFVIGIARLSRNWLLSTHRRRLCRGRPQHPAAVLRAVLVFRRHRRPARPAPVDRRSSASRSSTIAG